MPSSTGSERAARAFAILRGVMVALFSILLIGAPEKTVSGSATEPARSLALAFASRSLLLGIALVALSIRRRLEALGWLLIADAALQLFDTGVAIATHKGALALAPVVLGVLDAWAGVHLVRRRGLTID